MSNTLRNEAVPSTIGSKGIVYANGNIMYYKNPSGTVSQLNVANLNKTTITKDTDYTLTASDCNGTKTFVFNRFNDLDYNPLVAVLPTTATNLAVKIVNRSNSTLIVRPPVGSTIYMNGKTYTNTSELQLNYFNQNIELLAVDSTTWVGLTNNSTEYEIAKIIVNQLTYKCFILTTKGNLYFNGVNLDVSAGAFANFSDDIENTLSTSKNVFLPIPQQVSKFEKSYVVDFQYIYVSNTDETLYVLDSNGTVWTTGITNTSGKMGRTFSVGDGLQPVEANKSFNRIFAYNNLAFATTTDKELWAWGDNTNFRLGINDNLGTSIATPTRVLDSTFCIRDITIGSNYAMALSEDGRVFSWGVGTNGQLGLLLNARFDICIPLPPQTQSTWCSVTLVRHGGGSRGGGLKADNTAWTWGVLGSGETGDNQVGVLPYYMVVGGLRFRTISLGSVISAGLTSGGQLWTWGSNGQGQLGNNTSGVGTSTSSPVPVCGGHTFCQISTGSNNILALKADGSAWSWGFNNQGQLGDNSIINKSTPVSVFGGHIFCKIETSDAYSLALKSDGSAWTWGANASGCLGINSAATSCLTPVAVCGGHTFCQITIIGYAGSFPASFGLKSDGSLWSWGANNNGQLGDNTTVSKSTPVAVCGGHTFCQIVGGYSHIIALKADGSAWSWGQATGGALGDGQSSTNRSTPVAVCGGYTFCSVSAGQNMSIGLRADGKYFFWGSMGGGIMSMYRNGTGADDLRIPTQIETFSISQISICQIFANPITNTSFALASNGRLFGWGTNTAGIVGDGTTVSKRSPINVCGGHTFCSIVQTETGTAGAIRNDGTLWLWGDNASGQLGDGTNTSTMVPNFVINGYTLTTPTFNKISNGGGHTIGLRQDGSVWAWGRNLEGQLGDNTNVSKLTPIVVNKMLDYFCNISAGLYFSLGLKSNGSVWSWGSNSLGQLGDNTTVSKSTPVPVCGGHTFCQISAGAYHTLALKADGSLWAWGNNGYGQLGDGTTTQRNTPVAVCGGHTFCQISAGFESLSSALKADGSVWTWGRNDFGQLGNNTSGVGTSTSSPVPVCGGHTFCQISAGIYNIVALKANGSVWGWGQNGFGELGDGTVTQRNTPVSVCGNHTFCQISCKWYHTLALKSNGSAWAWGHPQALGDNNGGSVASTPVVVCGGHTFCQIVAGQGTSFSLKFDGSVWSWGINSEGQLGDNTITSRSVPVAVCSFFAPTILTSICEVKSTSTNFYARQANGTLWSWGNYNSTTIFGKLGNGTFSNTTLVPVSVCTIPNETVCKIFAYPNIGLTASINSPIVYTRNNKLFSWGSNFKNVVGVKGFHIPSLCVRSVSLGYSVRDIRYRIGNDLLSGHILKTDGSVWSWGINVNNNIGDGTSTSRITPVSACGNHTFCSISTGLAYIMGLKSDGSVWSWGSGSSGRLGNNNTTNNLTPSIVCGGHTFCQITSCGQASFGLKSDGSVWSWGLGTSGQLGNNTITSALTPVAVCGGHTFCQIIGATSGDFVFGLKSNGSLWGWGVNTSGQLGDNTAINKSTPVAVCGGHTFCQVYVNFSNNTIALKADGSAWTWGTNTRGQLGDNSTTVRSTPVAVCGGFTFCSVLTKYGNDYTTIARDVNNNHFIWGVTKYDFNFGRGVKLYLSTSIDSVLTPTRIYNTFLSSVSILQLNTRNGGAPNYLRGASILTNDGSIYKWGFPEPYLNSDTQTTTESALFINEPKYLLTPQEITKFFEVY